MKGFLLVSVLVSAALARPSVLQVGPLSSLQARVSASATASSLPQQLTVLRLVPGSSLDSDGQASLDNGDQDAARENARNGLTLSPLLSARSSASASSSLSDRRLLDSLEVSLGRAAAQREEQRRLAGQSGQAAQAQQQQQHQVNGGASSLLSATRLAQSLASLSPTGAASSSSSVQVLESPELSAARAEQQLQQLLGRETGALLVNANGQLVALL